MSEEEPLVLHFVRNRSISPELVSAINRGDLAAVKDCVMEGVRIEGYTDMGNVPVALAADGGHADILAYLLEIGANPNGTDPYNSPLVLALKSSHREIVEVLLPYSEKLDESLLAALEVYDDTNAESAYHDLYAYTFWRLATLHRRRDFYRRFLPQIKLSKVARVLGKSGVDFNWKSPFHSGDNAFLWLRYALKQDPSAIETLLDFGALPDYLDNDPLEGRAFIHDLILEGSHQLLETVMRKRRANLNVRDVLRGWTPLHYAAFGFRNMQNSASQTKCVELLLQLEEEDGGAEVDLPDLRNRSALALALRLFLNEEESTLHLPGINLDIIKQLLKAGADPHLPLSFRRIPIVEAAKLAFADGVLLENGEVMKAKALMDFMEANKQVSHDTEE